MPLPVQGRLERLLARRELAPESCALMGEYWYRPGELLVHRDDVDRISDDLRRWEAEEVPAAAGYEQQAGPADRTAGLPEEFPLRRFRLSLRMNVDAVVRRLRQAADGPEPRVAPNHVLGAVQSWVFGPDDNPDPAEAPPAASRAEGSKAGDFPLGALETGVILQGGAPHGFLAPRIAFDPARDEDTLDLQPVRMLGDADGHGTFVAGVALQAAPEVGVRVHRVLGAGVADDLEVAAGIYRMAAEGVKVVNLSLGGFTAGDVPPPATAQAVADLPPDVVVVAGAGNYGRRRPFFPAALKRVIAVAAVDDGRSPEGRPTREPVQAPFTNHGWWVDACAHGVNVLSTYLEFEEEGEGARTYAGWARWSGTSFAAPWVAARIAAELPNAGSAQEAAWRVVRDPSLPRLPDLGTYVA